MAVYVSSVKDALKSITRHNRPEDQPFFTALNQLSAAKVLDPDFLARTGNLYLTVLHTLQLASLKLPHLTARHRHDWHTLILSGNERNFNECKAVFLAVAKKPAWQPGPFDSLAAMKKQLPEPLFLALQGLDELYPVSLGAWVLSEHMMLGWLEAFRAVLDRFDVTETEDFLPVSAADVALDLAQDTVNGLPHIDGPTLRGMQAAMQHWHAIWAMQYAMIEAEDAR